MRDAQRRSAAEAQESFNCQTERLKAAGFLSSIMRTVSEALLQKVKCGKERRPVLRTKRPEVLHSVHRGSHTLNNVANQYHVPIAFFFSAPSQLTWLCPRMSGPPRKPTSVSQDFLVFGFKAGVRMLWPLKSCNYIRNREAVLEKPRAPLLAIRLFCVVEESSF